jgi:hypothetical protein
MWQEPIGHCKNPITSSGIEPATFRLVLKDIDDNAGPRNMSQALQLVPSSQASQLFCMSSLLQAIFLPFETDFDPVAWLLRQVGMRSRNLATVGRRLVRVLARLYMLSIT